MNMQNRMMVKSIVSQVTSSADATFWLRRLADGTLQVLVCSDVLSRGIDVAGVSLVVNYDAPSCVCDVLLCPHIVLGASRSDAECGA